MSLATLEDGITAPPTEPELDYIAGAYRMTERVRNAWSTVPLPTGELRAPSLERFRAAHACASTMPLGIVFRNMDEYMSGLVIYLVVTMAAIQKVQEPKG